jgi:hypothetical protein
VAYFYDQFHDDEIDVPTDLHPEQSRSKVPVEIKFIQGTYNALEKDEQARRIMFKPSYKCTIDYYEQAFGKYFAHFPVGLYCDIPDDKGIYRRWLVVGGYTELSNQLPAYMVIPCDWKLQWVYEHQCYENWCCLRSQSSYNSGVYRDYRVEHLENQKKTWHPMNRYTETIFYNQRVNLGAFVDGHDPVVWRCTKVEDIGSMGVDKLTWYQDLFDPKHDYIARDEDQKITGIWCNYYSDSVDPAKPKDEEEIPDFVKTCKITYAGTKPEIKINGSAKKLIVTFYDEFGEVLPFENGAWEYHVDDKDVSDLLKITTTDKDNEIRIQFVGDTSYIGKVLTVTFRSESGVSGSVELGILRL